MQKTGGRGGTVIDIEFLRPAGAHEEAASTRAADWAARGLSPRGVDWLRSNGVSRALTRAEAAWLRAKAEAEGLKVVTDDQAPDARNPQKI
jgi:hypothetical protein